MTEACNGHREREKRICWRPRPDGLEEAVVFTPGYNCPAAGPESHGVHGMEIMWLLRGPAGAVHFVAYTDWIPGRLSAGHGLSPAGSYSWESYRHPGEMDYPDGADLGYHAHVPQWEGQTAGDVCAWIGARCFCDGSGLAAADLAREFRNSPRGEHVIWEALEGRYADLRTEAAEASHG